MMGGMLKSDRGATFCTNASLQIESPLVDILITYALPVVCVVRQAGLGTSKGVQL